MYSWLSSSYFSHGISSANIHFANNKSQQKDKCFILINNNETKNNRLLFLFTIISVFWYFQCTCEKFYSLFVFSPLLLVYIYAALIFGFFLQKEANERYAYINKSKKTSINFDSDILNVCNYFYTGYKIIAVKTGFSYLLPNKSWRHFEVWR